MQFRLTFFFNNMLKPQFTGSDFLTTYFFGQIQ